MSSSLLALKAQSDALSSESKRQVEKKKCLILLIHDFLFENGYLDTAQHLVSETSGIISKHVIADNIDLNVILSDFEAYYELRFGKKPKLLKKLDEKESNPRVLLPSSDKSSKSHLSKRSNSSSSKVLDTNTVTDVLPSISVSTTAKEKVEQSKDDILGVQGTSLNQGIKVLRANEDNIEERILKPPPSFNGDQEMRQLALSISREIYQSSPNVQFDDIISLDEPKRLLVEAVQLPLQFPSLFTGILRPWRGILLHGPPGTGKTMLAKAVASTCKTTFFNISASTLVSKWRGDSEKLVRVLFELARYHAPSTIFLDEIDSILTSRGGEGNEHEASRRMKTELLIQMDGVKGSSATAGNKVIEQVFVMAASNLPWDLDVAVLRRLEKRVIVGLPVPEAREAMIRKHIHDRSVNDMNYQQIAQRTEGFSGADIELLCREAAMMPVRRLMTRINALDYNSNSTIKSKTLLSQVNNMISSVDIDDLIKSDPISIADMELAMKSTRPSSEFSIMSKYTAWQREFGST